MIASEEEEPEEDEEKDEQQPAPSIASSVGSQQDCLEDCLGRFLRVQAALHGVQYQPKCIQDKTVLWCILCFNIKCCEDCEHNATFLGHWEMTTADGVMSTFEYRELYTFYQLKR